LPMRFGWPLTHRDLVDVAGVDMKLRGDGQIRYMVDGDLLTAEREVRFGVSREIEWVVPRG
jgi:hypothetical protein